MSPERSLDPGGNSTSCFLYLLIFSRIIFLIFIVKISRFFLTRQVFLMKKHRKSRLPASQQKGNLSSIVFLNQTQTEIVLNKLLSFLPQRSRIFQSQILFQLLLFSNRACFLKENTPLSVWQTLQFGRISNPNFFLKIRLLFSGELSCRQCSFFQSLKLFFPWL